LKGKKILKQGCLVAGRVRFIYRYEFRLIRNEKNKDVLPECLKYRQKVNDREIVFLPFWLGFGITLNVTD
jgi:hypothetical protein